VPNNYFDDFALRPFFSREFASWPIPSGGGVVRNMVSTPKGDLYIACSGVNKVGIAQIDR
jgi:hypothetical protein